MLECGRFNTPQTPVLRQRAKTNLATRRSMVSSVVSGLHVCVLRRASRSYWWSTSPHLHCPGSGVSGEEKDPDRQGACEGGAKAPLHHPWWHPVQDHQVWGVSCECTWSPQSMVSLVPSLPRPRFYRSGGKNPAPRFFTPLRKKLGRGRLGTRLVNGDTFD